jgi:hypothetical protein
MKARNVKPGMLVHRGSRWRVVVDAQGHSDWRRIYYADSPAGLADPLQSYEDVQAVRLTDAQTFALRLIATGTVHLSGTRFVDDEHWPPGRSNGCGSTAWPTLTGRMGRPAGRWC